MAIAASCLAGGISVEAAEHATIRATCRGWADAFHAASQVYQQEHADVAFRFERDHRHVTDWLDGSIDLYATHGWLHHTMRGATEERFKAMADGMKVEVIGYTPVIALVHPDNPVEAVTIDQLRLIRQMPRRVSWRELGWERDGFATRWIHGVFETAWALNYDSDGDEIHVPTGSRSDPNRPRKVDEILAESRLIGAQKKMSHHLNEVLEAVTDDPDAMAIVTVSDKALASGLKMLAVRPDANAEPVAMTPAAVATGKYPMRLTARLYVHPDANQETKQFVAWLKSDAGQAVLARHQVYNVGHAPKPTATQPDVPTVTPREPWVGPIEGAAALLPTKMVSPYFLMARPEHQDAYEQAIFGALTADGRLDLVDRQRIDALLRERELQALNPDREREPGPIVAADVFVLPTIITRDDAAYLRIVALHAPTAAVLDALDVPLDPKQPARFEKPLPEIVKDWWPRVLTALHAARTQPRWHMFGITAAGIHQVSPAQRAYEHLRSHLRSQRQAFCVDGPVLTGTQREVLMRLLGLSKDRAGGFTPVFDYVVEGWQSHGDELNLIVSDAAFNPIAQVTIHGDQSGDRFNKAKQWLHKQTGSHRQRLSGDTVDDEARRRGAKLQSRMAWNAAVETRFAYADLEDKLTVRTPTGSTTQRTIDAVFARARTRRLGSRYWDYRLAVERLGGQMESSAAVPAQYKDKTGTIPFIVPDRSSLTDGRRKTLEKRWSVQAKIAALQYAQFAKAFERYADHDIPGNHGYSRRRPDGTALRALAEQYWSHVERASQLDPKWELPLRMMASDQTAVPGRDMASRLEAMKRYLADFPESDAYEEMLYLYAVHSLGTGKQISRTATPMPPIVDRRLVQDALMRQGLDAFFDFLEDFVLPNRMTGYRMTGDVRYQHYWHGLAWVEDYMHHCEPGPDAVGEIVADWSRRFDDHPTEAPHSDFVKLVAMGINENYDAFFDLLADLQRRWPEPRKLPWSFMVQHSDKAYPYRCAGENVAELLGRLDRSHHLKRDFRKWLKGELEAKDLPWNSDGFDFTKWREANQ